MSNVIDIQGDDLSLVSVSNSSLGNIYILEEGTATVVTESDDGSLSVTGEETISVTTASMVSTISLEEDAITVVNKKSILIPGVTIYAYTPDDSWLPATFDLSKTGNINITAFGMTLQFNGPEGLIIDGNGVRTTNNTFSIDPFGQVSIDNESLSLNITKVVNSDGQTIIDADTGVINYDLLTNAEGTIADGNIESSSTWNTTTESYTGRTNRLGTIPANPVVYSSSGTVDHVKNTDGSVNITFEWSFDGTGDSYTIDGFSVYVMGRGSASAYTFGNDVGKEQVYDVTPDKRTYILSGVAADKYYTFGVRAFRVVDADVNTENQVGGRLRSSIIQTSFGGTAPDYADKDNPYRPAATVEFGGNVTGTIGDVDVSIVSDNVAPTQGSITTPITCNDDGSITVVWSGFSDTQSGIAGYHVWRAIRSDISDRSIIATVLEDSSATPVNPSYTDEDVISGTTYWYYITCYDKRGNESAISLWPADWKTAVSQDIVKPDAPTNLSVIGGWGRVDLDWDAPDVSATPTTKEISKYKVLISSSADFGTYNTYYTNITHFTDFNKTDLNTWYYRVYSVDVAGNVSDGYASGSGNAYVLVDDSAPNPPDEGFINVSSADGRVIVEFNGSHSIDAASYRIVRHTCTLIDRTGDTAQDIGVIPHKGTGQHNYIDNYLEKIKYYYYSVYTIDNSGRSSVEYQIPGSGTIQAVDTTPPTVPTISLESPGIGAITIGWADVSVGDEDIYYEIYRYDSGGSNETKMGRTSQLQFTDNSMDAATAATYKYKVLSIDRWGNKSDKSDFSSLLTSLTPWTADDSTAPSLKSPTVPVSLTANADGSITASWIDRYEDTESGIGGYNVWRATTSNGSDKEVIATIATKNTMTYKDSTAVHGTLYYYYVTAFDNAGNETTTPGTWTYSVTANRTQVPADVTGIEAIARIGRVDVTWNPVSDANHYHIEKSPDSGSTWTAFDPDTIDTYNDYYTEYGVVVPSATVQLWRYRVKAVILRSGDTALVSTNWCTLGTSPVVTSYQPGDATAPGVPGNPTATNEYDGSIKITWTAEASPPADLAKYRIYRSENNTNSDPGTYVNIAEVQKDTLTYKDTGLRNGYYYWYKVSAVDYSSMESTKTSATTGKHATDLVAPTPPNPTATADLGAIRVTWSEVSEKGVVYEVWRCSGGSWSDGTASKVAVVSGGNSGSGAWVDYSPPIDTATTYTYKLKAVDSWGNISDFSTNSSSATSSINFTGEVGGTSASTVVSNAANGDTAYDGTVKYRLTGAPTNNPAPTGVTISYNANATINIQLEWGAYTQGASQADLILLFWRKDGQAPTVNDSSIAFNVNTSSPSYYIFEGVSPDNVYSFGIAAARRTESGLDIGIIQAPTADPDWRGVGSYVPTVESSVVIAGARVATFIVADGSTTPLEGRNRADYVVPAGSTSAEDTINTAINALPYVVVSTGNPQAVGTNTVTLATTASVIEDEYTSYDVVITVGQGAGQTKTIVSYATDRESVLDSNWSTLPNTSSTYEVRAPIGRILLLEGTYVVDGSIIFRSNVALEGQGAGTILRIKPGTTSNLELITNVSHDYGNQNIRVSNLQIDGNKTVNSSGTQKAVYLRKCFNCRVQDNYIYSFRDTGIEVNNATPTELSTTADDGNNIITGNFVYGNGVTNDGRGILIYGSNNNTVTGNTLEYNGVGIAVEYCSGNNIGGANTIVASSGNGIYLKQANYNNLIGNTYNGLSARVGNGIWLDQSFNNTVQTNVIISAVLGMRLTGSSFNNTSGNRIVNTSSHGILINNDDSDNPSEDNNILHNQISKVGSGCSNIYIDGDSSGNYVAGNILRSRVNNTDTPSSAYGITMTVDVTSNNIIDNDICDTFASGYMSLQGNSTNTISGNKTTSSSTLGSWKSTNNTDLTYSDGLVGLKTVTPYFDLDIAGNIRIRGANYLYFGGTGAADQDVNLYRSAANTLKTDDAFIASSFNALTLTAQTTGFTIAGGTTSKTLTVSATATIAHSTHAQNSDVGSSVTTFGVNYSGSATNAGFYFGGTSAATNPYFRWNNDNTRFELWSSFDGNTKARLDVLSINGFTIAHNTHDNTQAAHSWYTKASIEGLLTGAITSHTHSYLPLGGGTLTGALTLSGAPTIDLHAATKKYVDDLIASGVSWISPVNFYNVIDDYLSTPPGSLTAGDCYIVKATGTGAWAGLDNHVVQWNGSSWLDLGALSTGDRIIVTSGTPGSSGSFNGKAKYIGTRGASSWTLTAPVTGNTVTVLEGYYANYQYNYNGSSWVAINTVGKVTAGTGITITGNEVALTVPVSVTNGGTGLTSVTAGYIPFGSSSTALSTSSNLSWDNTNNRLTVSGTGGAGSGPAVLGISATADNGFVWGTQVLASNLTAGHHVIGMMFGVATSTKNAGHIDFRYAGSGLDTNAITFGMYAADDLVAILASGKVGIGTLLPNELLEVNGYIRVLSGYKVGANTVIDSSRNFTGGSVTGTVGTFVYDGIPLTLKKATAHTGTHYIDFRDEANTEIAWVGFGSSGNNAFSISNSFSGENINLITNSGTVAINGAMSVTGQVTSTLAIGTAPFAITSTTKVTNLNADLLDGLHTATAATVSTVMARDANGDSTIRNLTFSNLYGLYGLAISSYDEWLRINSGAEHSSGIYCGTSILRTDGNFQVGSSGAYFNVTATGVVTAAEDISVAGGKFLRARYTTDDTYSSTLHWKALQLGNNGINYMVAGRTAVNGYFAFYVNNTNGIDNNTAPNGTLAVTMASTGYTGFGSVTAPTERIDAEGNIKSSTGFKTGNFHMTYNSTSKCLCFNLIS